MIVFATMDSKVGLISLYFTQEQAIVALFNDVKDIPEGYGYIEEIEIQGEVTEEIGNSLIDEAYAAQLQAEQENYFGPNWQHYKDYGKT